MKIAFDPYMIRHLSLTTLLPMYRWASPFEDEGQWAIKCWKKAIEVSVEIGCETMISEFGRGASGGEKPGANTLSVKPHPEASSRFMRREIQRYVAKYWK
jgi:sugar phosphate isomerase/epimerase